MGPEFYQTFVSPLNNVIMWFFMFTQWVIYIEFQTVNQPCIPAVNHSWSWYTIFFHRLLNLLWISPLNINMGILLTSFLLILVVFDFGIKAMGLLKSYLFHTGWGMVVCIFQATVAWHQSCQICVCSFLIVFHYLFHVCRVYGDNLYFIPDTFVSSFILLSLCLEVCQFIDLFEAPGLSLIFSIFLFSVSLTFTFIFMSFLPLALGRCCFKKRERIIYY